LESVNRTHGNRPEQLRQQTEMEKENPSSISFFHSAAEQTLLDTGEIIEEAIFDNDDKNSERITHSNKDDDLFCLLYYTNYLMRFCFSLSRKTKEHHFISNEKRSLMASSVLVDRKRGKIKRR